MTSNTFNRMFDYLIAVITIDFIAALDFVIYIN